MVRLSLTLLTVCALVVLATFAYSYATRTPGVYSKSDTAPSRSTSSEQADDAVHPGIGQTPMQQTAASAEQQKPAEEAAPERIAQWIADATGEDAGKRMTAIVALADAPKAQALPALQRVLEIGEPDPERQAALLSLHAIALQQGDADGRIRGIFREVIYHGDDEAVSQSAQAYLEDVETVLYPPSSSVVP